MFPHRIVTTLPSLLPIIHENEEVVPPAIPRLVAPTIPPPSYRRGGAEVDGLWFDGNAFAAVADYLNNQEQGLLSSPGYARSFYTSKSDYGGVAMDQTLPARPYEDYDDDEPPRVRFLDRWGWRKVVFATVGFILFLLVLGLGTGYGLRNSGPTIAGQQGEGQSPGNLPSASPTAAPRPSQSAQPSPPANTNPKPKQRFPAGTYSFTAALMSVQTSCTSDPAVFGCYPFTTYGSATVSQSAATFEWTIESTGSSSYQLSSAAGSVSNATLLPQFSNLPMTLVEANTDTERYTFNLTIAKEYVVPNGTATVLPGTADCWYNSTVVKVELWTRQRATYPPSITDVPLPNTDGTGSTTTAVSPWPYRFTMSQVQGSSPNVPECRNSQGTVLGPTINGAGDCQCSYKNYDL
ncbi:hypothetical protein MCOR27_009233 [Pyricularia oryzae]|uniref:Tat pathway signal sequence n=2 Tax=Pyricularia TaxID=48558 RepID=A0ABQ8NFL1_PYRGI|nr:uncharacterized protein MGG_17053 [Pyricularia oryzae 70-15]KAH8844344.1 hypothetical protein MCOR01_005094 [Pyricularia oryzae]KAI6296292.1 hypothetical protein MCOR33_007096 [Pyricularia grisea]EHA49922.1 hypothetical protein MGG_17053 [Pyricularia oryzae 70-15]KAI6264379.1 hypothetical protein MCOR26_011385 [Pyricularia oryzae]KAI6270550.1 hypothetical protein MCOR27_009233 [Pyricularia oryzae]